MNTKIAIFDLDETLGDCEGTHIYENTNAEKINICINNYNAIFVIRPHVKTFIKFLASIGYDVAVWSAGSSEYVGSVIINGFSDINWKFVWTADQCVLGNKNLSDIEKCYPEYKYLIFFDNNSAICNYNRNQGFSCITVPSFTIDGSTFDDDFFEYNNIMLFND